MAQAIGETVFDILYLGFALLAGVTMLIKGTSPLVKKAGLMAALLGAGDAFHLLPGVTPFGPPAWRPAPRRWALESSSPPSP